MINDEIYQPVWELNQKVRCASNEKILRRQLELLTKYCHRCLDLEKIPEASESMVSIYRELVKAKIRTICFSVVLFGGLLYLLYRVLIKCIQLRQR